MSEQLSAWPVDPNAPVRTEGHVIAPQAREPNARCLKCGAFMALELAELRTVLSGSMVHRGFQPDRGPYEPCGGFIAALVLTIEGAPGV